MADSPLDHSVLDALAIFPLPDVVLFPGSLLPLHIFEPRYREMLADALAGARTFAVARLRPGFAGEDARAPVFDVAGVGYVVAADALSDGRSNIMVRGVGRVLIESEHPRSRPYRQVKARMLVDTRSTRPADVAPAHERLIAILDRLAEAIPHAGDSIRLLSRAMPSPGGCADAVASAMLRDPDARQAMLELLDPADRLDQMIEHSAALLVHFSAGPGIMN